MSVEDIGDPGESPSEHEFDYDRTVAISDGVFAIALTLLILNVGQPTTRGGFWDRLSEVAPDIGAYALSFAVIGLLWLRHHAFFRDLRRIDGRLAFLNLVYLGIIAFIPFPTSLLADEHGARFSVISYATTLALSAVVTIFIRLHAGNETAAISLDREVFEGGIRHEDGAVSLQLGGVELLIARRD